MLTSLSKALIARTYRLASNLGKRPNSAVDPRPTSGKRILVLGIGLTHKPSFWEALTRQYAASNHAVTQRWALVPADGSPRTEGRLTIFPYPITPRARLLNALAADEDLAHYDYVLISDDDVRVPRNFLDKFIHEVSSLGFAMAQPARTALGYNSHNFVVRAPGRARQTQFVEIGPILALSGELARQLLPFDESNPMTWGQELVWAKHCKDAGLAMGIVDSVPIDHCLRPVGASYDEAETQKSMQEFLQRTPHLSFDEAKVVIRQF